MEQAYPSNDIQQLLGDLMPKSGEKKFNDDL